ncbi:MAG: OB-fold nucleic acid binding domain-containing protein, partial [Planctomycetaceae bacterium]|nr:OB-fold nucleic acid binding domain-containing protein [Planctomycetaceae bacterium]
RYAQTTNKQLADAEDGEIVTIAGMVGSIKIATARKTNANGLNKYANFDLEDATGIIRCIAWPSDYDRFKELIKTENILIVQGKVDRRGREPNIVANRLLTLDQADKEFTAQVAIKFDRGIHSLDDVEQVRRVIGRYPGSTDVILVVDSFDPSANETPAAPKNEAGDESSQAAAVATAEPATREESNRVRFILTTSKDCQVSVGPEFQQALKDAIGEDYYELRAGKSSNGSGASIGR